MKKLNLFKWITVASACATLAMTTLTARADDVKAHGGTTFTFVPVEFDSAGQPTKFSHTVDGVVGVSIMGNCTFHADITAIPLEGGAFSLTGTFRMTTADGATSLEGEATGVASPDPTNGQFGNVHYDVKFTGGTGSMELARGKGAIDGFALFSSDFSTGKATWLMIGSVAAPKHDR